MRVGRSDDYRLCVACDTRHTDRTLQGKYALLRDDCGRFLSARAVVSYIAVFVLKRDVKLQPTNRPLARAGISCRRVSVCLSVRHKSVFY